MGEISQQSEPWPHRRPKRQCNSGIPQQRRASDSNRRSPTWRAPLGRPVLKGTIPRCAGKIELDRGPIRRTRDWTKVQRSKHRQADFVWSLTNSRFDPRVLAPLHGDNLRQNGNCNFFGRNRAEIETGRRLEPGEPLFGYAAAGQRGFQGLCLLAAADESNVVRINRERGEQRRLVAFALCRNDDVARPRFVNGKRITFNAPIDIAEGHLLVCRCAARDSKPGAFREVSNGNRYRARPANDDLRSRQDRLHEYVHRTLAWAHVLGKADAAFLLAGTMALLVEQVGRLHRDQTRSPVGKRILGRLEDRRASATAS